MSIKSHFMMEKSNVSVGSFSDGPRSSCNLNRRYFANLMDPTKINFHPIQVKPYGRVYLR